MKKGIELSVELTSQINVPVDVRTINEAPSTFIYKVLRGELINNTNDDLRCRVTERTLREYFDLKPILYQAMKEAYSS